MVTIMTILHIVHCKEEDFSFQMACFQDYMDIAVLLPRKQVGTHKDNTHLNTPAHKQPRAHTYKHTFVVVAY